MIKFVAVCCAALLLQANIFAANITVTLEQCEDAALKYSHKIKSLEYEVKSAAGAAESKKTLNYPSLVLEANLKYMTSVPELNGIKLGDNWNYSVGPAIYWTAFDGGARNKNYESLIKAAQAKEKELEQRKQETVLSLRIAYFRFISSLKTLDLLNSQLELALSQNNDVKNSVKAGAATKLDMVLSDTDVLKKQKQIKTVQILVTDAVKDLNDLTGGIVKFSSEDYSGGGKNRFAYEEPKDVLNTFLKYKESEFDEDNPSALSLELLAQYYELLSESISSSDYPAVNLFAKSSIDYPNGPVIESFNQNAAGGSFSMPLYQFGRNKKAALEKKYVSMSYEEKKAGLIEDLRRLFEYSKKKIKILEAQKELNINIVSQTREAADLMYKSYKGGDSKFLDVEVLNFRVIETQTDEVNTYADLLIQLAVLASLAKQR